MTILHDWDESGRGVPTNTRSLLISNHEAVVHFCDGQAYIIPDIGTNDSLLHALNQRESQFSLRVFLHWKLVSYVRHVNALASSPRRSIFYSSPQCSCVLCL